MAKVHVQCSLKRGNVHQTSWLPKEYAIEGKFVELYDSDLDVWENGWLVVSVGTQTFPSEYINERGRDYKRTREASDI